MSDRVLVTGGAGFIGSHLVELLVGRGYSVRVLDNLSFGRHEWLPAGSELMVGDIQDAHACRVACEGVQGVFHLAAMSRSAASLHNIEICTANNVVGTQNVLIAARDAGVRKVIYSASSTFYGRQPGPHVETMRPDFMNFYGLTKHVGEEYCLLFDRLYGLPAVVLRYFNVYGPRQPEEGIYALVLGIFLRQWQQGLPLTIHGEGTQTRDFVHVRDVALANLQAYESEIHAEVLNVGSGKSLSVQQLADRISPRQVREGRRVADADETLADLGRIRRLLGWEPTVSFEEGLAELIRLAEEAPAK